MIIGFVWRLMVWGRAVRLENIAADPWWFCVPPWAVFLWGMYYSEMPSTCPVRLLEILLMRVMLQL